MSDDYDKIYEDLKKDIKNASDMNAKASDTDNTKLGGAFKGTSYEGLSVMAAFNKARGTNYD
jgi:hypothetical protein